MDSLYGLTTFIMDGDVVMTESQLLNIIKLLASGYDFGDIAESEMISVYYVERINTEYPDEILEWKVKFGY